ncbi:MAG TPA: DNA-directed RNA polymerase subunit alpha C-terminal domain-containing protein [Anaerohalosphaeraceae bacterium]|nr:DNA-directed RNA polymerase subunit alpha C-terminal domain-containing protein [Anaerohalosphaeraceae bacterium]
MVTTAELQTELFGKDLPSFEQIKKLSVVVNSSDRIRDAIRQKAQDSSSNPLAAGIALWLCGSTSQAEELLKKAKDCAQKSLALGSLYRARGIYDKAIEQFESAKKQQAESLTVAMEKAETYRRAGQFDEAQKEIKTCINFQNVSAEYHYQLGRLQDALGQYDEAADNYLAAINLDPNHVQAVFQLGYINDLRGEEDIAMEYYKKATQILPSHVNALMNLAVLYEDREDYYRAMQCVNAVLRSHPGHAKAALFKKDISSSQTMIYDEEREKRKDRQNKILEIPISDFELSVRSRNCLKKMNICTLGDLLRTTEAELLSYKNFGETSLLEIKKILDSKGLRLGMALEQKAGAAPASATEDVGGASPELLNKSVDELELSVRARRALAKLGVKVFYDLVSRTEAELLGCKNFGVTSLNEIKEKLANFGLGLRKLD